MSSGDDRRAAPWSGQPVLAGLTVVELPCGVAGAMTGMLLADQGAEVVKAESPGTPTPTSASTYPYWSSSVWDRGKYRLKVDPDTNSALVDLVGRSDILIGDSSAPYGGADLSLPEGEPDRLIRCRITAYGPMPALAGRPGYDALVAARMGLPWDQRGYEGGAPWFIRGWDPAADPAPVPDGADQMGRGDGPVYPAIPWNSIAACLLALTGVSAALLVRARTGLGQRVDTSLLQGGLLTTAPTWQRVPQPDTPGYRLPYFDRRHPKGLYRCADGKWLHHWAPLEHGFIQAAASGAQLRMPDPAEIAPRHSTGDYEADLAYELGQHPLTHAAAFARFARDEWVDLFARAGKPAQPVRSPEDGLTDRASLSEGCLADVLGERQVGVVYRLSDNPTRVDRPIPEPLYGAEGLVRAGRAPAGPTSLSRSVDGAALDGVRILDLGLAQAGPYGTQVLADLGAEVIKVNNVTEVGGPATSPNLGCNRGKRSLAINLKEPDGQAILYDLVRRCDVVHHNLRTGVAERLGAGWEQLRRINPGLVYCHTRGFESTGLRCGLPGNDQMGQALAGTWYELGSVHSGGAPLWHPSAMGDFGTGVISAAAVLQALYARESTGRGQFVDTSIINLGYLYNSYTHIGPDGTGPDRVRLTGDLLGLSALCRIYPCRDGWLCLVAPEEAHWSGLLAATGSEQLGAFSDPVRRHDRDGELTGILGGLFTGASEEWFDRLDAHGVPCEIVDAGFPRRLFDDPELIAREVVVCRPHPTMGSVEQAGRLIGLSRTPGRIGPAAAPVGWHTREILAELGRDRAEIDELIGRRVVSAADLDTERSSSGVY